MRATLRKTLAVALVCSCLANNQTQLSAGEVDDSEAFVQSKELENDGKTCRAQIKIKKAGTYIVVAGFAKAKKGRTYFHKGALSGVRYFEYVEIKGDAGDVIPVRIDVKNSPPFNRQGHVGVFRSEKDIETTG